MQPGKRRILLLKRLARLREVEKRQAARKLATAQDLHDKLLALQHRSAEISASYSGRRDSSVGADLARQLQFTAGVEGIRGETAGEADRAAQTSRTAMSDLRIAERREEITAETLANRQRAEKRDALSREGGQLARNLKRPC